ncbi:MAG TPA: GPP34 family phosphoprotein, partial [Gemmatimonadales bacterium]|nr:GPP34 family phosphoprotein [Gemmatimonadales bacterium]
MLTDLYLTGCLEDKAGRPHRLPGMRPDDPVLCAAFDQIHDTDWAKLILENRGKAPHVVRDQLQATGWVQVQRHRMLGLIPTTRMALYDEDM